jgi:hypothetical protein
MNEADTCRKLVRPKLEPSGWDGDKHFYNEHPSFAGGRIIVPGGKPRRLKKKLSDFFDLDTQGVMLAIFEGPRSTTSSGRRDKTNFDQLYKVEPTGKRVAYGSYMCTSLEWNESESLHCTVSREQCSGLSNLNESPVSHSRGATTE